MIRVGVVNQGYPEKRNFIELPFKNTRTIKVFDLCKSIDHGYFRITGNNLHFFHNYYIESYPNRADLYHFFNTIARTHKPWVTTFESAIPRYNPEDEKGLALMAGKQCKKLIALSEYALRHQERMLEKFPELREKILSKVIVMPPPQKVVYSGQPKARDLTFTFVGADFFRKGGKEMLLAFSRILPDNPGVKLNVVTRFGFGKWKDFHITAEDVEGMKELMARFPDQIRYFESLPNKEVMALMATSHVGLLPSYGETYGYSVLEMMASACPVITTDLEPLNEFNSEERGWLVPVPLTELKGDWVVDTYSEEGRRKAEEQLMAGLEKVIREIIANPEPIKRKAENAIDYIRTFHDPEKFAAKLEGIYREALG